MKYLFNQQKDRISRPSRVQYTVLKKDLLRNKFQCLGVLVNMAVKEFDHRASIDFREIAGVYHITVTREGDRR
jgi:hypothetical protein